MGGVEGEILLDSQPATDYSGEKGAHIRGAKNLYWMDGQTSRENQSPRPEAIRRSLYERADITADRTVITYCGSGRQATQSYFTLNYLGYDVRLDDGSVSEWPARKEPVEK